MSIQRIKYVDHKYKQNHRVSARAFVSQTTGAKYRPVLNLTDMEFYIRNERTKKYVHKSGKYTNLNVLKRMARAKLESFGVPLKTESRDRQFGLVEAGMTQQKWEAQQRLQKEEKEDEL